MSVLGTLHQGSNVFQNNGRQCMSNSLTAFVHHATKNVSSWDTKDIDSVLIHGDRLHSLLFEASSHLYTLITDFPLQCEAFGRQVDLKIEDSYSGLLTATDDTSPYFCLETSLSKMSKFAILIIGSNTPAYACALINNGNLFYIFDPHSRDLAGMSSPNGAAVMTSHASVGKVKEFLISLAGSLGLVSCPFELTTLQVSVQTTLQPVLSSTRDESSDSDVPLASIRRSKDDDTDSDDVPLVQLQEKAKIKRRRKATGKIPIYDNTSDLDEGNSEEDPTYNLFPLDCEDWVDSSEEETTPKTIPAQTEVQATTPLKYIQVSVDAMRLLAGGPDFDPECVNAGYSGKSCSSNEQSGITQTVHPTCKQALEHIDVQDSSIPSNDISFEPSPEPALKIRGRKRRRDQTTWKDVQRKKALNLGEDYISRKGKTVDRKTMKAGCGPKCRMQCHQRLRKEQRETIFHLFWRTGNIDMRRFYVCHNVDIKDKKVCTVKHSDSKRKRSLGYHLDFDGEKIPVCKTFFLHTLAITDQFVFTAISKKDVGGHVAPDMRGRHTQETLAMKEEKDMVRAHIRSFPKVESHYCRKDSERQYLGASLNLATMYRLYREERQQKQAHKIVSSTVYCEIFRTEFNLGFHNPSKDRCDFCVSFDNLSTEEKVSIQSDYDKHHHNKQKVQEKKANDKQESRTNDKKMALCFDLQEVLMTPHSNASVLFYKRKLNTFNLSIFDLGSSQAICNVWHEGIAARGSNEIGSCVFESLKAANEKGVKYISLYSDSCGGQNRNKYFLTMLWFALNKFGFEEIEHNFFIKGHSKNENDSVHATIERVSKNVDVYTTPQWASIMCTAKQTKPRYTVRELDETCFFDFKKIASNLKNFDLDTDRQKVQWLNIKSMKLTKDRPSIVQILYDYNGEYHHLNLSQRIRKVQSFDFCDIEISVLNNGVGPGIDQDKYNDLQSICRSQVIPRVHHQFFSQLKIKSK